MKLFIFGMLFPLSIMAFNPSTYKKPYDEELKKKLTELQYKVIQKNGTEMPVQNSYKHDKREGIYVEAVSGEPLFSSKDKYDSGTGWPSFTKPISDSALIKKKDFGFYGTRTEIRSKYSDSHLGHVFNDGPGLDGKRFCMNNAALRFIPKQGIN